MSGVNFKYGFKIENGRIYDTKILSYQLKRKYVGSNIIYYLKESGYKRLYLFEPLLDKYTVKEVFEILMFNNSLTKSRIKEENLKTNVFVNMSNYNTLSRYPPTYLTAKKFALYKKTRYLLKRLN